MIKNLDAIKQRADIVKVVGELVDLQRKGAYHSACCPFHEEQTASFMVNARKQTYFCYGCQQGGDVFAFIQEFKRLSFIESVEYVARESGMRIEWEVTRDVTTQQYQANKAAKEWMQTTLEDVDKFYFNLTWRDAKNYDLISVDGRVYQAETLESFRVSYSPPNALYQATRDRRFNLENLVKAGLVKQSEKNGGYYDHFSGRTLFPLHDPQGKVVGWIGRRQQDDPDTRAKYKNSEESPVYKKSKYLYGLWQNGREILKSETVYVVEGPHDLMTMYENGIRNVVATCGTAMTADHVKLLNRYADNVVLLFDGDEAGVKAAARGVELLAAELSTKVCILQQADGEKIDPCDFIRTFGPDTFRDYLKGNTQDGIIWAIMREYEKGDLDKMQRAYQVAGRILARLPQIKRDMYIRELTAKNRLGSVKSILLEAVDEYLSENAPANAFSREQQDTITRYGVYVSDRKYYVPIDDGVGTPISNFYIRSMLLIVGNQTNERVIEIENDRGHRIIEKIKAEVFTDFGQFQGWVEARGNFMINPKKETWYAIRRLVFDLMVTAYPITVLGYHKEGFYTFKNGIYDGDIFQPANEYGVVQSNGEYFLITDSANFDNLKADDRDDRTVRSMFLVYQDTNYKYSLNEWGQLMRKAYGQKAIPAMAYYISALFRDIVFDRFMFFPHLNIFGVKGSGKNFFVESILATFGRADTPPDLGNITDKALPRYFSSVRNSICWVDEYKNDLSPEIIAVLRGAYGASGRTTAEKSMDNRTRRFDPRSGIIISGEHRPTRDIALYSRCCALETMTSEFTPEETETVNKLKEIEITGAFSSITIAIIKHRDAVQKNFYKKVQEIRTGIQSLLVAPETRILMNWCIVASVAEVLRDQGVQIPWTLSEILDICVDRITYQSEITKQEDHLATFWRMVLFLLEDHKVFNNQDLIVQRLSKFKIIDPKDSNSYSKTIQYEEPEGKEATFLFIRLAKIHPLYMQYISMQTKGVGLHVGTIEHYITTSRWYIGRAVKKFKGDSQRCLVLRLDEFFPVDFKLSNDVEPDF